MKNGTPKEIDMKEWKAHFVYGFKGSVIKKSVELELELRTEGEESKIDLDKAIEIRELTEEIKKLRAGKAQGEDEEINEFYKYLNAEKLETIKKIGNTIWDTEKIPEKWRKGVIYSIYKSEDESDTCNYRGISLLDDTYKILTGILKAGLDAWLTRNGKLKKIKLDSEKNIPVGMIYLH